MMQKFVLPGVPQGVYWKRIDAKFDHFVGIRGPVESRGSGGSWGSGDSVGAAGTVGLWYTPYTWETGFRVQLYTTAVQYIHYLLLHRLTLF